MLLQLRRDIPPIRLWSVRTRSLSQYQLRFFFFFFWRHDLLAQYQFAPTVLVLVLLLEISSDKGQHSHFKLFRYSKPNFWFCVFPKFLALFHVHRQSTFTFPPFIYILKSFQTHASANNNNNNSGLYYNILSFDLVRLILLNGHLINNNRVLAVSITGIICEKLKVLCQADGFSVHHASAYLDVIDFVSIR